MALAAVIIGGVTTVLMNANPLIPLDGYYALSDYLEVPNLRQRAFAHLQWLIRSRLFRLDVPRPASDEREQRIFLIYGLLAAVYIASIFLMIGGLAFGWLDRALGALGIALFVVGVLADDPEHSSGVGLRPRWRRGGSGERHGGDGPSVSGCRSPPSSSC